MKVKAVDFALLADRALDVYASEHGMAGDCCGSEIPSSVVPSAVSEAFRRTLEGLDACVPNVYTRIAVCIGCFPCMRSVGGQTLLTRLGCSDEGLLRRHGISPTGFLDCTEKFVASVCGGICSPFGKTGRIVFMKDRLVFAHEWVGILESSLGRKNVDSVVPSEFHDNPGILTSLEESGAKFTPLPEFSRFFAKRAAETLKNP